MRCRPNELQTFSSQDPEKAQETWLDKQKYSFVGQAIQFLLWEDNIVQIFATTI